MTNFQTIIPLILASGSPRRKELMDTLGLLYTVQVSDVDEDFHEAEKPEKVPALLAERKAGVILSQNPNALVLAADTVVIADGKIMNKPLNMDEARIMLEILSGKVHQVVTSFTLASKRKSETISDTAQVTFKKLLPEEISYYIQHGNPFDKAGAYGIQEWIGLVAVERIDGSYFTVMGLPTHLVWNALLKDYIKILGD